jgi:hypothetical protein
MPLDKRPLQLQLDTTIQPHIQASAQHIMTASAKAITSNGMLIRNAASGMMLTTSSRDGVLNGPRALQHGQISVMPFSETSVFIDARRNISLHVAQTTRGECAKSMRTMRFLDACRSERIGGGV